MLSQEPPRRQKQEGNGASPPGQRANFLSASCLPLKVGLPFSRVSPGHLCNGRCPSPARPLGACGHHPCSPINLRHFPLMISCHIITTPQNTNMLCRRKSHLASSEPRSAVAASLLFPMEGGEGSRHIPTTLRRPADRMRSFGWRPSSPDSDLRHIREPSHRCSVRATVSAASSHMTPRARGDRTSPPEEQTKKIPSRRSLVISGRGEPHRDQSERQARY